MKGPGAWRTPSGTMVALSGYQVGARRVADTYGLSIPELRPPKPEDLAGRLLEVRVAMHARMPHVGNLQIEPAEPVGPDQTSALGGHAEELEIEDAEGA